MNSTPAPSDRLGRPLGSLRISVTDRCNLRCQYCLPAELFGPDFRFLPRQEILSFEEITRLAGAFLDLGVRRIRITGGEPLLRRDLPVLVRQLRDRDPCLDLAMTTNGGRLGTCAEALAAAGLNRVNVSLDALDPEVAARMAGRPVDPEAVWSNLLKAAQCGLLVKVNTVLKRGVNEDQVLPLATRCRRAGFTLRFIEYMDVGQSNGWNREAVVTGAEILQLLRRHWDLEPAADRTAEETARRFRYTGSGSEVGFINSISEPFCRGCDRARISAEGLLYTCLFAQDGISVKDWIRTEKLDDATLTSRLTALWGRRTDQYSQERKLEGKAALPRPEMWTIGG